VPRGLRFPFPFQSRGGTGIGSQPGGLHLDGAGPTRTRTRTPSSFAWRLRRPGPAPARLLRATPASIADDGVLVRAFADGTGDGAGRGAAAAPAACSLAGCAHWHLAFGNSDPIRSDPFHLRRRGGHDSAAALALQLHPAATFNFPFWYAGVRRGSSTLIADKLELSTLPPCVVDKSAVTCWPLVGLRAGLLDHPGRARPAAGDLSVGCSICSGSRRPAAISKLTNLVRNSRSSSSTTTTRRQKTILMRHDVMGYAPVIRKRAWCAGAPIAKSEQSNN
jgi:hypothetical protein